MKSRRCIFPMLLLLALRASAQTATVAVQVYDRIGLSPLALQSFVNQTQEIFSEAGLSIHIDICGGASPCVVRSTFARILILRIMPGRSRKMKNALRSPLGQSFADHRGGTYASLFFETVQQQAADMDVPWLTVLSYAAAHEIGHLLLGDQAHTVLGLMKAQWDKNDFVDMKQNRLHFIRDQARLLTRCCASLSVETVGER